MLSLADHSRRELVMEALDLALGPTVTGQPCLSPCSWESMRKQGRPKTHGKGRYEREQDRSSQLRHLAAVLKSLKSTGLGWKCLAFSLISEREGIIDTRNRLLFESRIRDGQGSP
jgi:hypothetical protein